MLSRLHHRPTQHWSHPKLHLLTANLSIVTSKRRQATKTLMNILIRIVKCKLLGQTLAQWPRQERCIITGITVATTVTAITTAMSTVTLMDLVLMSTVIEWARIKLVLIVISRASGKWSLTEEF